MIVKKDENTLDAMYAFTPQLLGRIHIICRYSFIMTQIYMQLDT